MRVVASPYHLTSRELPAMAGLLLADEAVTLLPTQSRASALDPESVRAAFVTHPRYLRLLESWRWSGPLWRDGLVRATRSPSDPADPADDARDACLRIDAEPHFAPLRRFLRRDWFAHDGRHLDTLCADLLKGGPDPGVSIPIATGLDAFAARHAMSVLRLAGGAAGSVARRAEELIAPPVFTVSIPVLARADGHTLLQLRAELDRELRRLRGAIDAALTCAPHPSPAQPLPAPPARALIAGVRAAAAEYARAFGDVRGAYVGRDDEHHERITDAWVTLTARRAPDDAALWASLAAMRSAGAPARPGRPLRAHPRPTVTWLCVGLSAIASA
ncbi:MAG: hypothetical protein C0475_01495 [Planctomyces sp.]|nr:hypothetical protein [Planctomyces sp.]